MKWTLVRYKTKPDQADANQRLSAAVFGELQEKAPAGLHYADGPVWSYEGYLIYSDVPVDRMHKWTGGVGDAEAGPERVRIRVLVTHREDRAGRADPFHHGRRDGVRPGRQVEPGAHRPGL